MRAGAPRDAARAHGEVPEITHDARTCLGHGLLVAADRVSSRECAALIERIGWARTALGPRAGWPAALRSTVANMLATKQPMLLFSSTLHRIDTTTASREVERSRDDLLMRAPVAMALLTGPDHLFVLANPAFRAPIGRDPVGRSFDDVFPELRRSRSPRRSRMRSRAASRA